MAAVLREVSGRFGNLAVVFGHTRHAASLCRGCVDLNGFWLQYNRELRVFAVNLRYRAFFV